MFNKPGFNGLNFVSNGTKKKSVSLLSGSTFDPQQTPIIIRPISPEYYVQADNQSNRPEFTSAGETRLDWTISTDESWKRIGSSRGRFGRYSSLLSWFYYLLCWSDVNFASENQLVVHFELVWTQVHGLFQQTSYTAFRWPTFGY